MIFEATKYLPDLDEDFAVQSIFDDNALWRKLISKTPGLGNIAVRRAIRRGNIYIRLHRVNPDKPKRYKEGIWVVRNASQREDGVYGIVGFSKLSNPFWKLKHR